jgi:TPR repeat protein
LFRAAAEQGHVWAQFYIGALLQKGHGVPRDFEAARAWFTKAADGGNVPAMQELARIYELGLGVPADEDKARIWREQAARQLKPAK